MWIKPLKLVVNLEAIPRPAWMTVAAADRQEWRLTLECGHVVKRKSYDSKPLPVRCHCSKCGYSDGKG
jgi:hypothetical protein